MSIEARLIALKNRHKELHDKIDSLEAEKAPDKYITPLKREKLAIKDEIMRLENA